MDQLTSVLAMLGELEQDVSAPKNVKVRVADTIKVLNAEDEISIKASKAMSHLEELSDDSNMQADIRMQLFNIVSQLEVL